jgi:hypothetical protein
LSFTEDNRYVLVNKIHNFLFLHTRKHLSKFIQTMSYIISLLTLRLFWTKMLFKVLENMIISSEVTILCKNGFSDSVWRHILIISSHFLNIFYSLYTTRNCYIMHMCSGLTKTFNSSLLKTPVSRIHGSFPLLVFPDINFSFLCFPFNIKIIIVQLNVGFVIHTTF